MGDAMSDEFTTRLEALEGQRRQLWLSLSIAVFVFCAVLVGSGFMRPSRKVEVEQLILRDRAGQIRAQLGLGSDGSPELVMLDRQGQPQVTLHGSPNSTSGLEFRHHGQTRISLWTGEDGGAGVSLNDQGNRGASSMYLLQDGSAGIGLSSGGVSVEMAAQSDGAGGVVASNPEGEELARWGAIPESSAYQRFYRGAGSRPFGVSGPEAPRPSVTERNGPEFSAATKRIAAPANIPVVAEANSVRVEP
jgi:hypothetical protein